MKNRAQVFGWAMYDFANSAFATTVLAVLFSRYFAGHLAGGESGTSLLGFDIPGDALWAFAVGGSGLVVAVLGPFLGANADAGGYRKPYLMTFCVIGALATGALALLAEPGHVWFGFLLFGLAHICFVAGNIFYDAFLPHISEAEGMGRVSGFGWAMGYLGGGLCLVLNLAMVTNPGWFGIPERNFLPVRLTFLVVAVWWLLFALPTFVLVREKRTKRRAPSFAESFESVIDTVKEHRRFPDLFRFLIGFTLYNNGVQTIIPMASVFALRVLGMPDGEVIGCFLMIQGVALVGAFGFGWFADAFGKRRAIFISLIVWAGVLVYALRLQTSREFWVLGAVIGLVLGGTQAASRSLMAEMTPRRHSAKFFGFYALGGRFSAAIGPMVYGGVVLLLDSMRLAIFSMIGFFILGGMLLLRVDEQRGHETAEAEGGAVGDTPGAA